MEKKYDLFEEDTNMLNDPLIEYNIRKRYSPPLTEEELKDSMTTEEFLDAVLTHIDELFDK